MFEILLAIQSKGYNPFKGEVPTSSLITGSALATAAGLSVGTAINDTQPWLHFVTQAGVTLYIAKKHYRHSVTWNNLSAANIVNGTKTVLIGGKTYKVRLITGGATAAAANEWDGLLAGTHVADAKARHWASYTNADLEIDSAASPYVTQCQEASQVNTANNVVRGLGDINAWNSNNKTTGGTTRGWRPVLELVP
ncbi:hypothetical protein D3C78_1084120 [compost metagenome]